MAVFLEKLKESYDVVVVGGGPAGLAAAKSAAENGAKTLVMEEHREIGQPHHCSGWIWEGKFAEAIFRQPEFQRVVLQRTSKQKNFAPSGRLISDNPLGGWVVDRAEFDKVIAQQAARAGADISLNTRVVSLIVEEGKVKGVIAQCSGGTVEIRSRLVIGADGVRSGKDGLAKQSGLAEPRHFFSDVQVQFENVTNPDPAAIQIFAGSFTGSEFGFLSPLGPDSIYLSMGDLRNYSRARLEHNILRPMLKKAVPVSIFGGMAYIEGNMPYKNLIRDGLLLAGDAAGYVSASRAMISGTYAGIAAARAVKAQDPSAQRLKEYDTLRARGNIGTVAQGLRDVFRSRGYTVSDEWRGLEVIPDAELEKVLFELSGKMAGTAETGVADVELVLN